MNYSYEKKLQRQGYSFIAGADEAGRGCWAGPLVAASVILDPSKTKKLRAVNDSKKLSHEDRAKLLPLIKECSLCWAVAVIRQDEIDEHGLTFANHTAVKRALGHLKIQPSFIAFDYVAKLKLDKPFASVKHGDATILSIAAASIIAKETRDQIMRAWHQIYPQFAFAEHKGYGTAKHSQNLLKYGPSPVHRHSYKPIIKIKALRRKQLKKKAI